MSLLREKDISLGGGALRSHKDSKPSSRTKKGTSSLRARSKRSTSGMAGPVFAGPDLAPSLENFDFRVSAHPLYRLVSKKQASFPWLIFVVVNFGFLNAHAMLYISQPSVLTVIIYECPRVSPKVELVQVELNEIRVIA
jgi:hypothetical protein